IEIVERGCEGSALVDSQASYDAWAFGSALLQINASRTDCRWVVDSDARWLHLDQTRFLLYDVPFSGSIAVLYYLDPNGVVSPRTAHLTVTSRDGTKLVETITQAGAPSCSYVLSPSEATFAPAGGAGSFDITITPPTCDWTLNSSAPLYGIVPVIVERTPGF